jgi:hypothetical protein
VLHTFAYPLFVTALLQMDLFMVSSNYLVYHLEFGFHISRLALHVMLYVAFRAFIMRMIIKDRATLCLQMSSGSSCSSQ